MGGWMLARHSGEAPRGPLIREDLAGAASHAWYVLGSDCGFSAGIAARLVKAGPRRGLDEEVLLVDDVPEIEAALKAAGFRVMRADSSTLLRRGRVRSAPWLALFDSASHLTFSGPLSDAQGASATPSDVLADLIRMRI